ncbi:bifunctional 2-polyprenyl-6-hydroxyphenol methylase/3-demethylubiquinol 3-O-methyltransferase UbiG [Chitinophaga sp. sic0106]|uniref:class I SAM-dependent methyltransferase n=1 Tax=Chitinophaga sp. sic0106 TaxID=2854785 RepID=UPI001C469615|nr:methyltransferase domain-containing protein [Chitinophaga sp. sic0106]MBV7530863.1 class I SAM-dependent methyltransferase [Chitinophaga sp. sic0106]
MNKNRYSTSITASWEANAGNWIATIDHGEIESRNLVTNAAIVQSITAAAPTSIVDIGCGEGWLTRSLQAAGITAFGVDAIPALISNAIAKGGPGYAVATFGELATGIYKLRETPTAAVINFALLDETDSNQLLHSMPQLLQPGGMVFIQTLHPFAMAQQGDYITGWKDGSWNGMKRDFVQPYQWYFRTLADWTKLFTSAGLVIREMIEPLHPQTQLPASVIFVLSC